MSTQSPPTLQAITRAVSEALEERRSSFDVHAWAKLAYLSVSTPALWTLLAPIGAAYGRIVGRITQVGGVMLVDFLFLWTLGNLARKRDEPLETRLVDVGLAVLFLPGIVALGIANHEGIVGFVVRSVAGVFLVALELRESLGDHFTKQRQERLRRTDTTTPKQARIKEKEELERFRADQSTQTQITRETLKARVQATQGALQTLEPDAAMHIYDSVLRAVVGQAAPTAPHTHHAVVTRTINGKDQHFVYCKRDGLLGNRAGRGYDVEAAASARLAEHMQDCKVNGEKEQ